MSVDFGHVFRDDDKMSSAEPECIWSVLDVDASLFDAMSSDKPGIRELCGRLKSEVPVQRKWGFGETGAFVRPDRHARAMYLQLEKSGGSEADGCVAIKGTEVACENFHEMIERLSGMWNVCSWSIGMVHRQNFEDWAVLNSLDRFPLAEGKPPAALLAWDAIEEAEGALELQRAHMDAFGTVGRMPFPLFVYRWPDEVRDEVWKKLRPVLAPATARIVELQLADGLGSYVYHYPVVPQRVMHVQLPDVGDGISYRERMTQLGQLVDVPVAVNGWLDQVSRCLALGFVVTDPAALQRGSCIMPQNLCVDGGFVDLGGVRRIDSFGSEGEFRFAFGRCVQLLTMSIGWFLLGTRAGLDSFVKRTSMLQAHVWSNLLERMNHYGKSRELHPWLVSALEQKGLFDDLDRMLGSMFDLSEYNPQKREDKRFEVRRE